MCIFCSIVNGEIPSYKIYEDDQVIAILDISQVTKGHSLVIPKKHYDNIFDVDKKTLEHIISVSQEIAVLLKEKLNCLGVNILNNNGEVAGQSVNHLHFHIIPRYSDNDACNIEFKESGLKAEEVYKTLK